MVQNLSDTVQDSWAELLETIPDAVLVADDSGRYVFANTAACTLLQRDLRELVGLTVFDLARDAETSTSTWAEFQDAGTMGGEFDVRLPAGEIRTVQFMARTSFRPGLHLSVVRDVSDQKRLTERLRSSESFFVRAFNASPAPTNIRLLDTGVFVEANAAFSECTGYWRSEVIGRTLESIRLWENPAIIRNLLRQVRDTDETVGARGILLTKSGERREFSVSVRKFEVAGAHYAVSAYSDIGSL